MNLSGKVGRFIALFGLFLLLLFFASDLADTPRFNLFFIGFLALLFGIFLMRRGRVPSQPSGRFRTLRAMRGGKNKKKSPAEPESERQQGNL